MKIDSRVTAAAAAWVVRRDAGFTPSDQAAFEAWLRADPLHRAAWERLESTWTVLGRPRRAGAGEQVVYEIARFRRHRRQRRLGTAACAAAAVLFLGLVWQSRRPAPATPAAARPATVAFLPVRQTLPDGSTVELKDGAEIAVEFTAASRRIVLRHGEAFFQVAKNPHRPFLVEAGHFEVFAVGTEFSVQSGAGEVGVLVTEGRVAVNQGRTGFPGDTAKSRTLAFLDAAHRLEMPDTAAPLGALSPVAVAAGEIDQRLDWRRSRLEFSATPLAEAVAAMNRGGGVHFVIADPSLAEVQVSGLIRANDTEAFARFLQAGFHVQTVRRGPEEIVLQRQP